MVQKKYLLTGCGNSDNQEKTETVRSTYFYDDMTRTATAINAVSILILVSVVVVVRIVEGLAP